MTSIRADVKGTDTLTRTMHAAGDDFDDLSDPALVAGRIIAARASATAPRLSGRLAGSIRATRSRTGAVDIGSPLPYAAPIHWGWRARGIIGRPFLSEAGTATEPQWIKAYEDYVDATIDQVKGA